LTHATVSYQDDCGSRVWSVSELDDADSVQLSTLAMRRSSPAQTTTYLGRHAHWPPAPMSAVSPALSQSPHTFRRALWYQKTRVPVRRCCPDSSLSVLIEYRRMTDRHRQTDTRRQLSPSLRQPHSTSDSSFSLSILLSFPLLVFHLLFHHP